MTEHVALTTTPLPYRLTVDDFLRLDEAGAFKGIGKTELIRGEIFFMNAQHRPHSRMKGLMHLALVKALQGLDTDIDVLIEATVSMPPHSAPEPDLVITSEPDGEGPVPIGSVRLMVEIADTTLKNDLVVKAGVYAENAVPEYWVIDLKAQVAHQMWGPGPQGYAGMRELKLGERISSAAVDGLIFDLPSLN